MLLRDKVRFARTAIDKRLSYERFKYSDDMYSELYSDIDSIWELVIQYDEMGSKAWHTEYEFDYL